MVSPRIRAAASLVAIHRRAVRTRRVGARKQRIGEGVAPQDVRHVRGDDVNSRIVPANRAGSLKRCEGWRGAVCPQLLPAGRPGAQDQQRGNDRVLLAEEMAPTSAAAVHATLFRSTAA